MGWGLKTGFSNWGGKRGLVSSTGNILPAQVKV